jgi:hypothetical protein
MAAVALEVVVELVDWVEAALHLEVLEPRIPVVVEVVAGLINFAVVQADPVLLLYLETCLARLLRALSPLTLVLVL